MGGHARVRYGKMTQMLSDVFDRRHNSLNAVRLAMATGVIFWHSYPLTGNDITFAPLRQLLGEIWVDGFFAISGFLITGAWYSRPQIRHYIANRALRILPAFYACLVVTAFVVAPLGAFLQGGNWRGLVGSTAPLEYIASNLSVWITQSDIGGTPQGIPYPGTWNGSLWTLGWEVLCYAGILLLGVSGLLKRAFTIPCAFAIALICLFIGSFVRVPFLMEVGSRFAVMFLAGALILQFQHMIRCSWPLVVCASAITVGAMWLPDYRLIAALPWAYAVLSIGALVKYRPIEMKKWDVSYGVYIYAFPLQQLLLIAGFTTDYPLLFGLVATIPTVALALLSRWAIELPAMKLKGLLGGPPVAEVNSGHAVPPL